MPADRCLNRSMFDSLYWEINKNQSRFDHSRLSYIPLIIHRAPAKFPMHVKVQRINTLSIVSYAYRNGANMQARVTLYETFNKLRITCLFIDEETSPRTDNDNCVSLGEFPTR